MGKNAAAGIVTDLAPAGILRAAVNLGNPVLAQGTPAAPSGVAIDIGHQIAARLGVGVEFSCFDAARDLLEATVAGRADVCFLAIEPARADRLAYTAPYVLIEGVYAVPAGSPLMTAADVDRAGVRVGVKHGSAYDLFLTRTLAHATLVRGEEGTGEFVTGNLKASGFVADALRRSGQSAPVAPLAAVSGAADGQSHGPFRKRICN